MAKLLIEHKCLLVLDGLEPLQHGGAGFNGQLKDRAMKRLLQTLEQQHTSLCIITTRINVHDISDRAHVLSHPLDNLQTTDGVALLRSLGVQGREQELENAVTEVEGHALTLHLLGNALHTYLGSDIRKRDTLDELVDDYDEKGKHAFRVMQGYQVWLRGENGEPTTELQLLYLLGLFDHPIEIDVLQVLWDQQIEGLTAGVPARAWKVALRDLQEKHRLLSKHGERPDLLDCHPLIREYFGRQLEEHQPEAWQQAHDALYHYYKDLPEKELPDTVEEMQPLFHAVAHGCAAGLHQQVLDEVYWLRINRENEAYLEYKLGAHNDSLAVMANFFCQLWQELVVGLIDADKAIVLGWAGFNLHAVGRLREAVESMQAGIKISLKNKDWRGAANAASSLSELQLSLGRTADAVISGEQSFMHSNQSGDIFERIDYSTIYADALHQTGQTEKATALFVNAERLQLENQPEFPRLYSSWGSRYCDLLLAQGRTTEVLDRSKYDLDCWENHFTNGGLLEFSLPKLTLGRAHHYRGDLTNARSWLEQAVESLREAGHQDYLCRGLLARAALYRDLDKFDLARHDLAEIWGVAESSEMRLHIVDYHLEMARLLLASKSDGNIGQHVRAAKTLINETGYHRRDGELAELEAQV